MNIESLLNKINLFEELVIKSGFKRDVEDYSQAIQQPQNRNLTFMKNLSEKILNMFQTFENNSLDSNLEAVLRKSKLFTQNNTSEELLSILSNSDINADQYFQKLNSILNSLKQSITTNHNEVVSLKEIFKEYVTAKDEYEEDHEQALVSLIFKDLKSTGSLKEFSRVLNKWNKTLLMYHTLLKSESPKEISLVEIQNGSIDVIFNIDFDVAVDLTELIKVGLLAYGGYLTYKSKAAKEIIQTYMGNTKLIASEKQREALMLDNVKDSIKEKALQQHKQKLKLDKNIDKSGVKVKAEQISAVITEHIVKGNEVKLLTPPQVEDESEEKDLSVQLREESAKVQELFKQLPEKEKQLLLNKYSLPNEEEGEGEKSAQPAKKSVAKKSSGKEK